jgi:hypothetical protein
MFWWNAIKETFRDEYRDEYCHRLKQIGVNASLAEREIPEESYSRGRWSRMSNGESLGLICMEGFPAPFVNIRRQMSKYNRYYFAEYLVPDTRLSPKHKKLSMKIKFERSFPVFGKRTRTYWAGNDLSTGLTVRLNRDISLGQAAMLMPGRRQSFRLSAKPDHKLWVIRSSADTTPSRQLFDAYQSIAQHLLDVLVY